MKENKKIDKYLDLARELKRLWNIKVMVIPLIFGALGTVPKEKKLVEVEIRGWIETIQTITLLRSARILRKVLETRGDWLLLRLQWKTTSWCWCGKLIRSENRIIIMMIIIRNYGLIISHNLQAIQRPKQQMILDIIIQHKQIKEKSIFDLSGTRLYFERFSLYKKRFKSFYKCMQHQFITLTLKKLQHSNLLNLKFEFNLKTHSNKWIWQFLR